MKKIVIVMFLAAGLIAMAGITYAVDDENEIVKRHSEWMKKVMVGQNAHKAIAQKEQAVEDVQKIEHSPLIEYMDGKVSKLTIYGIDGNPVYTHVYRADGLIDHTIGYGAEAGDVQKIEHSPLIEYMDGKVSKLTIYDIDGNPAYTHVYRADGLIDHTISYGAEAPLERESLNMGGAPISSVPAPVERAPRTEVKSDGAYSSDVGTSGSGNIAYGGKADIDIPGDVATQPTSGAEGTLLSKDGQPASQEQPRGPISAEEMAAMEARLTADKQTTTTLVNGKIAQPVEQPMNLLPIHPPSKAPGAEKVKGAEGAAAYVFTSEMRVKNSSEEARP